jgi:hypothetical protein
VDEHIDDTLHKKVIEPSKSPWSSSIVLVQKKSKDGSIKYRFCVDYRSLNAVTKPDAYPIPNIVDTLDSLGHSKIFSVLDMASGYLQIPIKPEHREKTAFSCHRGHFQFIKMPFGLNNAPATYQRCSDVVLMGLKGRDCLVYLDDIICFSATMEEHARKLQLIFERLDQPNFKIQPEKCELLQTQLSILAIFVHLRVFGLTLKRLGRLNNIRYINRYAIFEPLLD